MPRIRYPPEMKELAREMYFTIGEDGDHAYYVKDIIRALKDQFPDAEHQPNQSTVFRWTKSTAGGDSWETQFDIGIRSGTLHMINEIAQDIPEDVAEDIMAYPELKPRTEEDPATVRELTPPEPPQPLESGLTPEEQVKRQAGKILALRASTAVTGYNIAQDYFNTIKREIDTLKTEADTKGTLLYADDIEALFLNNKKTQTILRVLTTSEVILNNLNLEIVEERKSKVGENIKDEMEEYMDEFRDIAIDKLTRQNSGGTDGD